MAADAGRIDLGELGLDRGGHLLIKRALRALPVGGVLDVYGSDAALSVHLRGWCRSQGHAVEFPHDGQSSGPIARITRGRAESGRWRGAVAAGASDPALAGAVAERPPLHWGLAARGARVEQGSPSFDFPITEKEVVWADEAAGLYAQAAAAQWDPATAIDWAAPITHPPEIEDTVVQVMTFLIENETAALIVPASFLAKIHPHFREVLQLLAIQAADEARHIEVFTRRAQLLRKDLGLSTAGGQASLKTLLEEPDFALAFFLLSVLGEGSFLSLLWFLHENAPDPITRQVSRLAAQDEARHVAFGLAHLRRHLDADPALRPRLAAAIERRHDALEDTAGLNEEVFDALVVLAAGSWEPQAMASGFERVVKLQRDMDHARRQRLQKLGFGEQEAEALSALHTRNFM
jgi:TusA-related sulfurtransferase